jgi:hypothetical protein
MTASPPSHPQLAFGFRDGAETEGQFAVAGRAWLLAFGFRDGAETERRFGSGAAA